MAGSETRKGKGRCVSDTRKQLAMMRCMVNLCLGGSGLAALVTLLKVLNEKERDRG